MYKIIIRSILAITLIILISIIYLSNFGIKTNKFNSIIQSKIIEIDPRIKTEIKEVNLILDLKNKQINTKTEDLKIYINNKSIQLSKINLNIDLLSIYKKKYIIKNLEISTKENKLKDIFQIIQLYKFNFSTALLESRLKEGDIKSKIVIFFDKNNGKFLKYQISGNIKNAKLNLLENQKIHKINFNFKIIDQNFLFSNIKLEYNGIIINSDEISVIKKNKKYFVKGDFKNKKKIIKPKFIKNLFNFNFENLKEEDLKVETDNQFNFLINEKMKIKNINIKSKIILDKINFIYKSDKIKEYVLNYDDSIILKDIKINLDYSDKNYSIMALSKYGFNKEFDNLKFNLIKKNDNYKFDSEIEINNSPLLLEFINYEKEKEKFSILEIKGNYLNQKISFDKINYTENKNLFQIIKLKLNNKFKISDLSKLKINYINKDLNLNRLNLQKIKNGEYILSGDFIDVIKPIEDLFKEKKSKRLFRHFENLNLILKTNIKKTYITDIEYLNDLQGSIEFKKNKIYNVKFNSKFKNNEKFFFSIKSTENNQKVTTLYSENAVPFVSHFKFIKGFSGGKIDYSSISKNNISRSQIKIFDFKVKEVPALATLLSLASLQGIADIMTGEGLRFDEFEMNYKNNDNLMTIEEIYSIGPAISLLMEGYIEKNSLISLRGTLVPATTINKAVGTIPILGNILVGKKTGEGVFGVSFKIKGPPKKLKTTVNPVKTLTPRFITRTLRKIKKN